VTGARAPLSEDDAVRLFCGRATDARGTKIDDALDLAIVRRIVRVLGCNRAAIQLAAARVGEISLERIAELLERFDQNDDTAPDLRELLADGRDRRLHGRLHEAATALEDVLERADDVHAEAEAHRVLGAVYRAQGRGDEALEHAQRACTLFESLGDPARHAMAVGELGACFAAIGRLREARTCHERALAVHRSLGNREQEGVQLSHLGVALHRAGLFEEARRAHRVALEIHRAIGNPRLEGADRLHLAYVAHALFELDEASDGFDAAIEIFRRVHDRALEGVAMSYAAALEVEMKRPEIAGPRLREALAIHAQVGSTRHEAITLLHLEAHEAALGQLDAAREALMRSLAVGAGIEPEHRAWALALLSRFDEARAIDVEDACTKRAIALLESAHAFRSGAISIDEARSRRGAGTPMTMRMRRALAVLDGALASAHGHLEVARDGRWFRTPDGERVDLARRGPLRLSLAFLVARRRSSPGQGATWREVLAVGWKGERVSERAGFARVRNALAQLRKLGLRDTLCTRDDGYLLDPAVPLRIADEI